MAASAIFCNLLLSTSFNPGSEKSCILLDWVLALGIPVSRSTASGILTLPYGNIICSMHMSLSVSSPLAYNLVLGRDWLFFSYLWYHPHWLRFKYYPILHFISFLIPH
ncbi:hypothetical protein B0H14DRAFT_2781775 [Mycena olivaceomarginata]|nr:hypothetical protein B0H14DRAFT_2781775 [Mycena olivaceomarginata]